MSGIFGIVRRDGRPVEAADLERMRAALAHRGPDGGGTWRDGAVGLGQLMLHSTPESLHERLPWQDTESGLVITADARIHNRDELAAQLGRPPPAGGRLAADTSSSVPDSHLILETYKRWGEACVERLLGDFAFAIWDPRERRLFCARDQMGAAPFCYVLTADCLAFCSETEAMLVLPGVSSAPNENLIATILVPAFENRGDERTWHRDVQALSPAHTLTMTGGGEPRKRRYWALQAVRDASYASTRESLEHFHDVFGAAVRCRLRAPGKLAVMLSGGLDSAGIAAMARRQLRESAAAPLHAYSAVDDDADASIETRAIRSMTRSLDLVPHRVAVPSLQGMVDIDDVLEAAWQHAHPVDNMLLLPAMMCLAASRDGNRVMLEGASGDVTMKLPARYVASFLRRGRPLRAWRECTGASRNHVYLQGTPPLRLFGQNLWRAFAPASLQAMRQRAQRGGFSTYAGAGLIRREFAERLRLPELLEEQALEAEAAALADWRRPDTERSLVYVQWGLTGYARVAARYGVEARDPWADPRVFEFFSRLPVAHLVQGGWTKHLVRRAFGGDLAAEVLWRRDKEHLGWKFTQRILHESKSFVDELARNELLSLQDYVDLPAARELFARWAQTDDGAARDRVYELVTLMLWLRRVKSL